MNGTANFCKRRPERERIVIGWEFSCQMIQSHSNHYIMIIITFTFFLKKIQGFTKLPGVLCMIIGGVLSG